jgi:hypothetical protein
MSNQATDREGGRPSSGIKTYLQDRGDDGTAKCGWCYTRFPAKLVRRIRDGQSPNVCLCGAKFIL